MGKARALLPYIRYSGICGTEGYGFQPFSSDFGHFRHKGVFLFMHSSLELGTFLRICKNYTVFKNKLHTFSSISIRPSNQI